MYVNDRGQINYHALLKKTRELEGSNLKKASEGLCTDSEFSRAEIGDRQPEKLMRDRMLARVGISGEEFEEYLRPEEFRQWEIRRYILHHINNGNIVDAEICIGEYEKIRNQNPVQAQFADTMRYIVALMKGESRETLSMLIELAVVHTIASIEYAFKGTQLLAGQELNLIAEYARVYDYQGEMDIIEWRFDLYKKILNYVDNSILDALTRSKIYPRVTCLICELLLEKDATEGEIYYAYEMCNRSIENLRNVSRLYYMVELLEYRKQLIERILKFGDTTPKVAKKFKLIYEKDSEWEEMLKGLYEEYGLPAYMQNFTYLYVETECNSVVEVIRTRRNMWKLSRVRVSENICTDKTIERMENYAHSPTIVVVRDLFERIGLCAEYKRARIVTDDVKLLAIRNKLHFHLYNDEFDEVEKCVEQLEAGLDMELNFNQQEIQRYKNRIAIHKGEMDKETLYRNALNALECTLPFGNFLRKKEKYVTRSELACMIDLAFKVEGEVSATCYAYLKSLVEEGRDDPIANPSRISVYEPIITEMVNVLNEAEKYEESYRSGEWLMKECLRNRRAGVVVNNLYNKVHVYEMLSKPHKIDMKYELIEHYLKKDIILAEITKRSNWQKFLEERLEVHQRENGNGQTNA